MLPYRSQNALRMEDFRVQLTDRPGWVWGSTRVPEKGEEIFCAAGIGMVKELHGKTGNGSRLVQIEFADPKKRPFFASTSNVLLAPGSGPARARQNEELSVESAPRSRT
jgi:hypothetical protein